MEGAACCTLPTKWALWVNFTDLHASTVSRVFFNDESASRIFFRSLVTKHRAQLTYSRTNYNWLVLTCTFFVSGPLYYSSWPNELHWLTRRSRLGGVLFLGGDGFLLLQHSDLTTFCTLRLVRDVLLHVFFLIYLGLEALLFPSPFCHLHPSENAQLFWSPSMLSCPSRGP